jgi:hypothetical protein
MKNKLIKLLVVGSIVGSSVAVQAVPITGSIAFSGGVSVNNVTLGSATAITGYSGETVSGLHSGSYAGVPTGTPTTFATFNFVTPVLPAGSLWTFTLAGPVVYKFQATTENVPGWDPINHAWSISGGGLADITGFDQTPGTWTLSITQSGDSLSFASTAAATQSSVPDGGTTVLLLGAALSTLGLIKRRLA